MTLVFYKKSFMPRIDVRAYVYAQNINEHTYRKYSFPQMSLVLVKHVLEKH